MSGQVKKVPYVKFTDPQLKTGDIRPSGRLYTGLLWSFLFAACMAVCLYYCMVKPIVITSANVSDDKLIDLSELIPLSAAPSENAKTVSFSVPAGVRAADIALSLSVASNPAEPPNPSVCFAEVSAYPEASSE